MPGDSKTFAVVIEADDDATIGSCMFNLSYSGSSVTNRKIIGETSKYVSIVTAISLSYGYSVVDNDNYDYPASMTSLLTAGSSEIKATGTEYAVTDASLYSGATQTVNENSLAFFYTVTYSDDVETYYQEYVTNNTGTTYIQYNTPTTSETGDRYFTKTTDGNSSCYEGLTFHITDIKVTIL